MKKVAHIFLALLFIFSNCGLYPLFFWLQQEYKKESQAKLFQLQEDRLEIIDIDLADNPALLQIPGTNEMIYKGEMYDVAKKVKQGKFIRFYCYADKDEDRLTGLVDQQTENNTVKTSSKNPGSVKSFKENVNESFCFYYLSFASFEKNIGKRSFSSALMDAHTGVQSPPPRLTA